MTRSDARRAYLYYPLLGLAFCFVYWLTKLPTRGLFLAYYDDGETLYHAFAAYSGLVPHRDDANHHFSGYILPFVAAGRLFGFSAALVSWVAAAHHLAAALLLSAFLRRATPGRGWPAPVGGLLLLTAREPWVLGFFQQYQTNVFTALLFLCAESALRTGGRGPGFAGGLVAGAAFAYDQRSLVLAFVPAAAALASPRPAPRGATSGLSPGPVPPARSMACSMARALAPVVAGAAVLPAAGLVYLAANDALVPFAEQTLVFPSLHRSGSAGAWSYLKTTAALHLPLADQTPALLVGGVLGAYLLAGLPSPVPARLERARTVLLVSFPPLALMPLFGGRELDYYVLTWHPWLAASAALGAASLGRGVLRPGAALLLAAGPVTSLVASVVHRRPAGYAGDGAEEAAGAAREAAARDGGAPGGSLYVWAYRLDVYVRAGMRAWGPFASRIFFHPDSAVHGPARAAHVYPPYEERLLRDLAAAPPTVIVTFEREGTRPGPSRSDEVVRELLRSRYRRVADVSRADFTGARCRWEVFRLATDAPGSPGGTGLSGGPAAD